MTTYPAGLSKAIYLQQFSKEGVEVGNYTSSDIQAGKMPSYANVFASGYIPASNTTFGSVLWTAGTHTGNPITLNTSTIQTCLLLPVVGVSFIDDINFWTANTGLEVRLERSIDGGASYTSFVSQNFYCPTTSLTGTGRGSGALSAMMTFSSNTSLADVTLRLLCRAIGYTPSSNAREVTFNMRVLVFNKV